jgi:hypothetical protein
VDHCPITVLIPLDRPCFGLALLGDEAGTFFDDDTDFEREIDVLEGVTGNVDQETIVVDEEIDNALSLPGTKDVDGEGNVVESVTAEVMVFRRSSMSSSAK